MKFILSFIIAVISYLVLGLIAWNIVFSFLSPETLISEVLYYKTCTYCGVVLIAYIICEVIGDEDLEFNKWPLAINGIGFIVINLLIGENMWDSTALILTIIFNLINVFIMTYAINKVL